MPATVHAATIVGIEGTPVAVEADVAPGLPTFNLVGLPDTAVKEARDRVRSAIRNCGITFPRTRVTVNLAPADLRKEGPAFDLPIACAVLLAAGHIEFEREDGTPDDARDIAQHPERSLIVGELGLDGSVRSVAGALSIALAARRLGFSGLVLPAANAEEAAVVGGIDILPVHHLTDVVRYLLRQHPLTPHERNAQSSFGRTADDGYDLALVAGLAAAKRALEVAAAGGHNLLFVGPPGSGKSLLARCLPSILPPMVDEEQLEATVIHSVAGILPASGGLLRERPFRSPHHSASDVAIVGGGTTPKPGEVSLAHRGVLFLDELPEFGRSVLEALRQPLEDGVVTVSRAAGTVAFPARFQLVAAMNPCPCGYWGDDHRSCACPPGQMLKYQRRISGPLLDRIDLVVEVPRQSSEVLLREPTEESSARVRERVATARERQRARAASGDLPPANAECSAAHLRAIAPLPDDARRILIAAAEKFRLSSRATLRVLRVSRTIADLAGSDGVAAVHISEALQYRAKFQVTA